MDRTTQHVTNQSSLSIPPAQLFVGPHAAACAYAHHYLKQLLCPKKGTDSCITCKQIEAHQHHALLWLQTEKQYTRENLQPIFHTISFALHEDHHFFFVIQQAERLTPACANSLLKSLEEPSPGYHFLLLTDRVDQLLPTVRSRCIVTNMSRDDASTEHEELLHVLSSTTFYDPAAFLKKLDQSNISEQESLDLLDRLFKQWAQQYKQALQSDDTSQAETSLQVINIINQALARPPMPGSSKLLWKDLFLQIKSVHLK